MKDVTLPDLLRAGAHFGHKSSRWNPKMKPFIFGHRNNIHIFDLEKTRTKLLDGLQFIRDTAARGGVVMFVGTKKQAKDAVKAAAEAAGVPFVTERWLGGTFTNFRTVQRSMKKLERLVALKDSPDIEAYTKKERLLMDREIAKLNRLFSGMSTMKVMPDAIFVLSSEHDQISIREAKRMKIPVVAIVDTNSDPEGVDYVVPGNDDSVQAISLYANLAAEAVNEGKRVAQDQIVPQAVAPAEPAKPAQQ